MLTFFFFFFFPNQNLIELRFEFISRLIQPKRFVSGYAGFLPFFLLFYEIKFFDMNVMKTAKQHTHTHKASFFFYGIEILFLKIKKEKNELNFALNSLVDSFNQNVLCQVMLVFYLFFFFFMKSNFLIWTWWRQPSNTHTHTRLVFFSMELKYYF
jgi:hypothetical protein